MDFWDDVYKKVTDAANYTAKETGKLTGIAKVKFNLMKEKSKLDDTFERIGELYYSKMRDSAQVDDEISYKLEKCDEIKAEIERLTTEINLIKDTRVCSGCGETLGKDMVYCPKCGTRKNDTPSEEQKNEEKNEQ